MVLPWVYYMLSGNNQLAVYHGAQFTDNMFHGGSIYDICANIGTNTYMYPAEYNTYGAGSSLNLSYKTDKTGTRRKNFNIHDHLGNVRAIIRLRDTAEIIAQYDYAPFGEVLWSSGADSRLSFIGKEKDNESSLGDFGVRKYDDGIGRFLGIAPKQKCNEQISNDISRNSLIKYYSA